MGIPFGAGIPTVIDLITIVSSALEMLSPFSGHYNLYLLYSLHPNYT